MSSLGDVDTKIRNACNETIQVYFKNFSPNIILPAIKDLFNSSNIRLREQLLLNVNAAILENGPNFVTSLLSVSWFQKLLFYLLDDPVGTVRDAALNVFQSIYSFDANIKQEVEKSNIRSKLLADVLTSLENCNTNVPKDIMVAKLNVDSLKIDPIHISEDKLLQEIELIASKLGEKNKKAWQSKVEAMVQLQGILLGLQNKVFEHKEFLKVVQSPLKEILMVETRAAIIKEVTQLLTLIFHILKDKATILGDRILEALIKHHGTSNKINSDNVDQCILTMLDNSIPNTLLEQLETYVSDKNNQIRAKCTEYLLYSLQNFSIAYIKKNKSLLESCLRKYLMDPDPNVKKYSRQSFICYKNLQSKRAAVIYGTLDSNTQIAILKEEKTFKPQRTEVIAPQNGPLTPKKIKKAKAPRTDNENNITVKVGKRTKTIVDAQSEQKKITTRNESTTKIPDNIPISLDLNLEDETFSISSSFQDDESKHNSSSSMDVNNDSILDMTLESVSNSDDSPIDLNDISLTSLSDEDLTLQQNMFEGNINTAIPEELTTILEVKDPKATPKPFSQVLKPHTRQNESLKPQIASNSFGENLNPNVIAAPTTEARKHINQDLVVSEVTPLDELKEMTISIEFMIEGDTKVIDTISKLVSQVEPKDLKHLMDQNMFSLLKQSLSSELVTVRRKTTTCFVNIWKALGNDFTKYLDNLNKSSRDIIMHYHNICK